MESSLKKLEQNKYELTIEVGREELSGYVKIAEAKIAKEVQIDGFRKGKAPEDIIRKKVGEQYILETALDIAIQDSLDKTVEKEKLEVLRVNNLDIKENSASKLVYKASLTVFPEIVLGNLSSLAIEARAVKVESKEINEALESIAASRAKFLPKDGAVEKGDRIEIDFEVTLDGLPIEGGVSKNHPLIVGDNKFIPGFEDELLGMQNGVEKKFSLVAPPDYFHKAIAGKKLDFAVKVVGVQKIEKPEVTDDFAKSLGKFQGLSELKNNIQEGILQEKKIKEKERLRVEILTKILDASKIQTPDDMVKDQLDAMVAGFDNQLHQKGMELSMYLTHLNKTQDDLRKDWQKEAEKQVKFQLILKKFARDNHIQPSLEEIEAETNKILQVMSMQGQLDQENLDIKAIKNSIANELTNEKTLAFLEDKYIKHL